MNSPIKRQRVGFWKTMMMYSIPASAPPPQSSMTRQPSMGKKSSRGHRESSQEVLTAPWDNNNKKGNYFTKRGGRQFSFAFIPLISIVQNQNRTSQLINVSHQEKKLRMSDQLLQSPATPRDCPALVSPHPGQHRELTGIRKEKQRLLFADTQWE